MKEPAKDFQKFSESKITNSSKADILSENKSEQNPNLLSTEVNNKQNKKLSSWKRILEAYSSFYDRIKPILIVLWIIVFLVVLLPILGELIIARSFSQPQESPNPQKHSEIIFDKINYQQVASTYQALDQLQIDKSQRQINQAILNTLDKARKRAESRAKDQLDVWIDGLMVRVDYDFLDWYFNYFNRKWREDSALITWIAGGDVKKRYGETFEKEFSKRVISQADAEQKLRQIAENAVKTYVNELHYTIARIRFEYNIPQTEWDNYLDSITFNIPRTGNTSTTLYEITAIGAYPIVAAIIPKLAGASISAIEKLSAITGLKLATKIGLTGAAKTAVGAGAKLANPVLLFGFGWFEVNEQKSTVEKQKPVLHENILESFKEIEDSLLYSNDSGIMTTLNQIENSIRNSIRLTPISQKNIYIPTI